MAQQHPAHGVLTELDGAAPHFEQTQPAHLASRYVTFRSQHCGWFAVKFHDVAARFLAERNDGADQN